MAVYRRRYHSKCTGAVHVYTYHKRYMPASERVLRAIRVAGSLTLKGNRWRAGGAGQLYQHTTIQPLIDAGRLRRVGDIVRLP